MDITNRIRKKTDLKSNDSLSFFDGHASQQNHNVYQIFYDFLNKVKPKRILEIGTALGGFTQFLRIVSEESNLGIKILSYDVISHPWYDEIRDNGVDLRVENIFIGDYESINEEVKEFIKSDGTTIVLCDGGNKIKEFNLISNYLKIGDFIMAHDYAHDNNKFEKDIKNKIWNWCEIKESDVSEASVRNNLSFYSQDIFENVAWICKIKS